MTRHDYGEPVVGAERPDGPLRTRMAGEPGKVSVGHHLAIRHAPQRADDVKLERRPTVELELDVLERHRLPREEGLKPLDQVLRFRHRPGSPLSASRRYRRPRGWWEIPPT